MDECKICYSNITNDQRAHIKCFADSGQHFICNTCYMRESERRKQNGFDYPNECFICKPHSKRLTREQSNYWRNR